MKKHILYFAITLASVGSVIAQSNYAHVNYSMGIPLRNTEFIDEVSFRGFGFGFKWGRGENLQLGVNFGFQSTYQFEENTTYYLDNGAITTDLYKYSYQIPIAVDGTYLFMTESMVNPYVGMGFGINFVNYKILFSEYSAYEVSSGFLMQPRVGALLKIDDAGATCIFAEAMVNYSTNNTPYLDFSDYSALNINVGVRFAITD